MELFGYKLNLKKQHCILNDSNKTYEIKEPCVNIYIRLRNKCNATCKFCEFRGNHEDFNFDKFTMVLKEIRSKIKINKLSFTGGEPTSNIKLFGESIKFVKDLDQDIFTVVNTNGVNLFELLGLSKYLDSIAMSRHHYLDKINNSILGFEAPSNDDLARFQSLVDNKELMHLSCNLIKSHIDNEEEILKYLEFASSVGINDIGLVSLMKANDYCVDNQVLFDDIAFKSQRILNTKEWKNKDYCRCANYMYVPEGSDSLVKFYGRYYCQGSNPESQLVFDGINLKDGFDGNIII